MSFLYYETLFSICSLKLRRFLMFDSTDADYVTAQALYKRCAYEALKALRSQDTAAADAWVALANSLATLWTDSDLPQEPQE
jgi:hypothetical protein